MTATRPYEPRSAEQRIRDGIVAIADWLTDHDEYEVPWEVLFALCPDGIGEKDIDSNFGDLLHIVAARTDRTDLPFDGQLDLDYMTGVRR